MENSSSMHTIREVTIVTLIDRLDCKVIVRIRSYSRTDSFTELLNIILHNLTLVCFFPLTLLSCFKGHFSLHGSTPHL